MLFGVHDHASDRVPAADRGFAALGLSSSLCQVVAELGFAAPTPVQAQAIPLLLAGRDLMGQSHTGSGKTAAFALAILQRIKRDQRHPQALMLCPTRELCAQVAREFRKLARREAGLQVLILSGGQPINPQVEALEQGVHVVVGTPGASSIMLVRGSLDWMASRRWWSTRRTGCWTWGSARTWSASSAPRRSRGRRCSFPPPSRGRSRR